MKLFFTVTLLCLTFAISAQTDLLINGTPQPITTFAPGAQDNGTFAIEDGGTTIRLDGNAWKKANMNYTVTENTILELEVRITGLGEIQGILFDTNNSIGNDDKARLFQFAGVQAWGILDFSTYTGSDWASYTIRVGDFFTGDFPYLVFAGDKDGAPTSQQSFYRNVRLYEESTEPPLGESLWVRNGSDIYYSSGNVGIGTSIPDAPLTVKGRIHAEEVKVDLAVPAPDYVFESDYELRTLKAVGAYIKKYGHLPKMPSAATFEKEGIRLGEMDMRLLEKIEELTLYALEQQKRLDDQEVLNCRLAARITELEALFLKK